MTVGLPGTGIGGIFYVLSALAMPLRELYRRARGRTEPSGSRWRLVLRQTAIAGGIIVGIWAMGWLLGIVISRSPIILAATQGARSGVHPHNFLRTAALIVSVGTLAVVLLGVQVLRLLVPRRAPRREALPSLPEYRAPEATPASIEGNGPPEQVARVKRRRAPWIRVTVLLLASLAGGGRRLTAQDASRPLPATELARRLARADSAYAAGDPALAAREYAAVLAADPENSRATFRLAQLHGREPAEALTLFRRYVSLEPSDPWGYMAVGDVLARLGRYGQALRWYDAALRLAPVERDAALGRARVLVRAGRTDAAVSAYERWVAAHPGDAEAWRELGRERLRAGRPGDAAQALERAQALAPDAATARRLGVARAQAAPALEPTIGGSGDSDGNGVLRLAAAADAAAGDRTRLGVAFSREQVGDGLATAVVQELALRAKWRPKAVVNVDAAAGGARLDVGAGAASGTVIPTGLIRARWHAPGGGAALELRMQRSVLDATPRLIANRVTRTELRAIVQVPVAMWLRVRGIGRSALLSDSADLNHRTTVTGVLALAVTPAVELSGQFHQTTYSHATTAGYFAPRLAQTVEAGSYMEFETARVILALDLGVGVQRVADQGASVGSWRRALRLYSLVALPLSPGGGRELRLELEGYDAQIGNEVATSAGWRYGSAALSLRWALP